MSFRARGFAVAFALIATLGQAQEQIQSSGGQTESEQSPTRQPPLAIPVHIVEDQAAADARQRSEDESRQREIEDLAAQQGMNAATQAMNDATQRMAEYAFWSTLLVAVGTVLLFYTLYLTRQANKAARDAVDVTVDIGDRQLRAYVHVERAEITIINGQRAVVSISFKNYGATPARKVRQCIWTEMVPPKEDAATWPADLQAYGSDLAPGQVMDFPNEITVGPDIATICVSVRLNYQDHKGTDRTLAFSGYADNVQTNGLHLLKAAKGHNYGT